MPLSSTGRIDATKLKWILLLGVVIAISASIQTVLIVLQPENPQLEKDEYLTLDRSRSMVLLLTISSLR